MLRRLVSRVTGMKRGARAALALAALGSGALLSAQDSSSIIGTWRVESGEARIMIEPCGDGVCGTVVWMLEPNDERGNPRRDIYNPDETLRDRILVGLRIMEVFPKNDKLVWKGTIYDPDHGKTYHCTVEPESDDRIKFRGYIGIPLFGRTTHWTRVTSEAPTTRNTSGD